MSILLTCPQCGHQYKLPQELAGKQGKCSRCGRVFVIPEEKTDDEPGLTPDFGGEGKPGDGPVVESAEAGGSDDEYPLVDEPSAEIPSDSEYGLADQPEVAGPEPCRHCGRLLPRPESLLQDARCPHCGTSTDRPHEQRPAVAPAAAAGAVVPGDDVAYVSESVKARYDVGVAASSLAYLALLPAARATGIDILALVWLVGMPVFITFAWLKTYRRYEAVRLVSGHATLEVTTRVLGVRVSRQRHDLADYFEMTTEFSDKEGGATELALVILGLLACGCPGALFILLFYRGGAYVAKFEPRVPGWRELKFQFGGSKEKFERFVDVARRVEEMSGKGQGTRAGPSAT